MSETVTVKNRFNIEIVMCCASCKHNGGAKSDTTRQCKISKLVVKPSHLCSSWTMREALNNAGKGGGVIKKKHYLEWMIDTRNQENLTMCLEDRQAEYERKFGSRFIVK